MKLVTIQTDAGPIQFTHARYEVWDDPQGRICLVFQNDVQTGYFPPGRWAFAILRDVEDPKPTNHKDGLADEKAKLDSELFCAS